MRVFVAEYVCGGGLLATSVDAVPAGLRREGAAMLSALVADATEVSEVVVPVDPRLAPDLSRYRALSTIEILPKRGLWPQWVRAAEGCDAAIIVAPESDGVLAQGVAMLRAGGVDCIAGSGDFLRVASDKVLTAKVLHAAGVSHPIFMAHGERRQKLKLQKCDRFVVKPRDGCGTRQIARFDDLDAAIAAMMPSDILQQWRPGRAISVSFIASGGNLRFLPAVSQLFHADTCEYAGGQGPLCDDDQRRATAIASRAVEAMPPTARGFIGMDLLLGERPSEDCVIEINPRLTTSYVGLRKMTSCNLAAQILERDTFPILCDVGVDEVHWTAQGDVRVCTAGAEAAVETPPA